MRRYIGNSPFALFHTKVRYQSFTTSNRNLLDHRIVKISHKLLFCSVLVLQKLQTKINHFAFSGIKQSVRGRLRFGPSTIDGKSLFQHFF